jgi:hypothetical protein
LKTARGRGNCRILNMLALLIRVLAALEGVGSAAPALLFTCLYFTIHPFPMP